MNKLFNIILACMLGLCMTACSEDEMPTTGDEPQQDPTLAPKVVSTLPAADATDADVLDGITVTYNKNIYVPPVVTIDINGTYIEEVSVSGNKLYIPFPMDEGETYTVTISKPSVRDSLYNFAADYTFTFSTKTTNTFDPSLFDIDEALTTASPMKQTASVYDFLRENFGKKVIAAAVSSGALDTDMADKIQEMTGKYPVINSFDFLHHINSAPLNPSNWIDYTDMTVPETWWADGGLVSFMWHWNVPCTEADKDNFQNYAFYCNGAGEKNTDFNAANAVVSGTYENTIVNRDLDVIADYLLSLQQKRIPVIWRPLHEAAGNVPSGGKAWFWWGNAGADAYKALWRYMYDYFKAKGINNLIWVWTSVTDDADWYPGDEYVDIIGYDYYESDENKFHQSLPSVMAKLQGISNRKILALSECGAMPSVENMMKNGDVWSWVMPWNGDYTTNPYYNPESLFREMYESGNVITRDEMPDLK